MIKRYTALEEIKQFRQVVTEKNYESMVRTQYLTDRLRRAVYSYNDRMAKAGEPEKRLTPKKEIEKVLTGDIKDFDNFISSIDKDYKVEKKKRPKVTSTGHRGKKVVEEDELTAEDKRYNIDFKGIKEKSKDRRKYKEVIDYVNKEYNNKKEEPPKEQDIIDYIKTYYDNYDKFKILDDKELQKKIRDYRRIKGTQNYLKEEFQKDVSFDKAEIVGKLFQKLKDRAGLVGVILDSEEIVEAANNIIMKKQPFEKLKQYVTDKDSYEIVLSILDILDIEQTEEIKEQLQNKYQVATQEQVDAIFNQFRLD